MSEILNYHSVEELQALSLEELQALWELVPTERQRRYQTAYDREVKNAGAAGSDRLEQQVAAELLRRYDENGLVPVGARWAKAPSRVQEAARRDETLTAPEGTTATVSQLKPRNIALAGIAILLLLGVLVMRLFSGGGGDDLPLETPTPTVTPTPEVSPTPTPLALDNQDEVINEGDAGRETTYPVNLQVQLDSDTAPRVWVVQRRAVQTSAWNYDPNPDTASYVGGMSVRPVIGIPWSEDNQVWFDRMEDGTTFTLHMNTGAILRFEFAAREQVRRSDTASFRQLGPGLVLVLIGQTGRDGLPTATRTLITATYPPEQELSRSGALIQVADAIATPQPTATPVPQAVLDVQLIRATHQPGRLTTVLRLYNAGAEPVRLGPDDVWLALGYAEDPPGPRVPAEGLTPFMLLPEQAADLTLTWRWDGEPFAALAVGGWRFVIQIER